MSNFPDIDGPIEPRPDDEAMLDVYCLNGGIFAHRLDPRQRSALLATLTDVCRAATTEEAAECVEVWGCWDDSDYPWDLNTAEKWTKAYRWRLVNNRIWPIQPDLEIGEEHV